MLDIVMHNVLMFLLVNPPLLACERRSCCSRLSDLVHTGSKQFDKSGRKRQWRRYANGKTSEQNASIYELVGEVVPYHRGVGEEGIFKIVCSCRALLICIVVVFARCGV